MVQVMAVDLVIDADGHVSEPRELLGKWMPKEHADKLATPFYVRRADGMDPGPSGPYSAHIKTGRRPGQQDPTHETAQAVGMPLAVHPQTMHWGEYGVEGVMGAGCERLEKYSYVHTTAFTFELMIALMHMIGEGVFDRYPQLKVAYMEGSCG